MNKIILPLMTTAMTFAAFLSTPTSAQVAEKGMGRNMLAFADCDLNGDKDSCGDHQPAFTVKVTTRQIVET